MNIHTNKNYQAILAFLKPYTEMESIPAELLYENTKQMENDVIRQAIKDRYAAKYRVLTHFKNQSIILEKVEYKGGEFKHEDIAEQAHAIFIATLAEKKEEILAGLNSDDEIYKIDAITRDLLFATTEILHEKSEAFDLVRKAIREVLNLTERDLVLTKQGDIFVKKFVCLKQKEEERKQQLESSLSLDEVFVRLGINETIKKAVEDLTTNQFDFARVSPSVYSESYLTAFMNCITEILIDEGVAEDIATITARKLLKEEYSQILLMTAKKLLERVGRKEKEVDAFLMWFDGKVEVDKKGKYLKPELLEEDGRKIYGVFIKTIMVSLESHNDRLKKAKKTKERNQENITIQNQSLETLENEHTNAKKAYENQFLEVAKLKKDLERLEHKLQKRSIHPNDYNKQKKQLTEGNRLQILEGSLLELKKEEEKALHLLKEGRRILDGFERNLKTAVEEINGIEYSIQEPLKKQEIYTTAIAKVLVAKKIRV